MGAGILITRINYKRTTGGGGGGAGVPFSFTEIPFTDPDIINPGRGAEQWGNGSLRISNPDVYDAGTNPTGNQQGVENSFEAYYRKEWTWFEKVTQDNYDFDDFDSLVQDCINNGQRISFGIMPVYSGSGIGENENYGGHGSSFPEYLHNLMQAEANPADRDYNIHGWWIPNWNHPAYLGRLRALHAALFTHIMATSFEATAGPNVGQVIPFRDVIYCIDIRGYGQWGEWHTYQIAFGDDPPPPGNQNPTTATFKEIIDAHTEEFPNWPLVMLIAGFNGSNGSSFPILPDNDEAAHYALAATNAWGKCGWRRDQVGSEETYLEDLLELNTSTFGGSDTFGDMFLEIHKTAPGTGEPYPGAAAAWDMANAATKAALYGHTSFGNGNYPTQPNTGTSADNTRLGFKTCGYRLKIIEGEAPTDIVQDVSFEIRTTWENVGVAPTYDEWDVQFELHDSGGNVVWSDVSTKVLKLFRPDQGQVETVDNFTVPNTVPADTYTLAVRVLPSDGVLTRPNMALAIQGINAGNSYHNKFYVVHDEVVLSAGT